MLHTPSPAPQAPRPVRPKAPIVTQEDQTHMAIAEAGIPIAVTGILLAALLAGLLALVVVRPDTFDTMVGALLSDKTAWYLTRSSAFMSYIMLWLSMALGLVITNRMARVWPGGPTVIDLHEHTSLLGLGFGALHALVLVADRYIGYSLAQIVIPFANTEYRPLWVGLGQIGFYLSLLVTLTFYARRWFRPRTWRVIHYLSFLSFVMVLAHGIWSGTDSGAAWAQWLYLASGISLIVLTVYRILVSMQNKDERAKRTQNPEPRTQNPELRTE